MIGNSDAQPATPPSDHRPVGFGASTQGIQDSHPPRLGYRLAEVAQSLGVSRRTIERIRSAGKFPPHDFKLGRIPLWRPQTLVQVHQWIALGGKL
jgi:hypothetical protein